MIPAQQLKTDMRHCGPILLRRDLGTCGALMAAQSASQDASDPEPEAARLRLATQPVEAAMHVSPRPIRLPEHDPAPPRGGPRPVLAFVFYAVLAMAGTLLLAWHGGAAFHCGKEPAACGVP